MRRPSRLRLLLGAVLLLGLAALLTILAGDRAQVPERVEVEIPRTMRPAEARRLDARATLPPAPAAPAAPGAIGEPPAGRDPLHVALPGTGSALVLEANAIRHGRLGELLLACQDAAQRRALEELRVKAGIDVEKDVDRVAFDGPVLAVSGFFQSARLAEAGLVPRGEEGQTTWWSTAKHAPVDAALWRGQLLLQGPEPLLRAAVDRLEGRAPDVKPSLEPDDAYGEAYGVLTGSEIQELARTSDPIARRLGELARRIEFHVDAMQVIAARVQVSGEDGAALEDVARSVGAALALGRAQAAMAGNREVAELLEQARVVPWQRGFAIEVAVPEETLERWFAFCRERAERPPAAPAERGAASGQGAVRLFTPGPAGDAEGEEGEPDDDAPRQ